MTKVLKLTDVPTEGRPYTKMITLMGKCLSVGGDVDFTQHTKTFTRNFLSKPEEKQVIDVVMRWPS